MSTEAAAAPATVSTPAEARLAAYAVAAEGAFAGNTLHAIRSDTAVYLAWAKAVAAFVDRACERNGTERLKKLFDMYSKMTVKNKISQQ